MDALNAAYAALSDADRRSIYDRSLGEVREGDSEPLQRPMSGECTICGWSPALPATFRQETGMLLRRAHRFMSGNFCGPCAWTIFRDMTNRTLITGWWGITSFFVTFVSVGRNVVTIRKFQGISAPQPPPKQLLTPRSSPLHPGPNLTRRAGVYVAAVVLFVAIVFVNDAFHQQPQPQPQPQPAIASTPVVGSCLTMTNNRVTGIVSCSSSHNASIVAIVTSASRCPADSNEYVTVSATGYVYCINTSG